MTRLYNRKCDLGKRRRLRHSMTEAEKLLWDRIRKRKINGYKFRRQYSIGGFIIDFYSPDLKTAIEVDGGYHLEEDQKIYDKERQYIFESIGIKVLRFTNNEIFSDINQVVEKINKETSITSLSSP
ncbi:MAG: endonuclease domain-containing protein [Candidatus Margulisiibacteriota bacterium]|nr:endonuclease domain-containing protein [Candidatus Margulisiibacteriota bacterium]